MKKMGIPSRKAAKRNQTGVLNTSWKGGRVLVARRKKERLGFGNGYMYVLDPNHPNANKSGYVAEHISIVTELRGRPLVKGECVHHIDMNKLNNDPSNLAITTRGQHARWHRQLEEIAIELYRAGKVEFHPNNGYKLNL